MTPSRNGPNPRRVVRYRLVALVAVVAVLAVGYVVSQRVSARCATVGSPRTGPGLDLDRLTVWDVEWVDDSALVAFALGGPFASGDAAGGHVFRIDYPQLTVREIGRVPASIVRIDPGGTLHWLADDGVWGQSLRDSTPRLEVPIDHPAGIFRDWTSTKDAILVLREDGGGRIEAYSHTGSRLPDPPFDPGAWQLWSSYDGTRLVTRVQPSTGPQFFVVHEAGEAHVVPYDIPWSWVAWLTRDGKNIVLNATKADGPSAPPRPVGLVAVPLDDPGAKRVIDAGVSAEVVRLSHPRSDGTFAYTEMFATNVCFGSIPEGFRP